MPESTGQPLTVEEFTFLGINTLQDPRFPGRVHVVYSGFNVAFRKYFEGRDPTVELDKLKAEGKIGLRTARGGAVIWDPSHPRKEKPEAPEKKPKVDKATATLAKMGL